MYQIFKIIPGLLLYFLLFILLHYATTHQWPDLYNDAMLMLTLVVVLLTHRRLLQFLEKKSHWFFSARIVRVLRLMENLNRRLNETQSYFELKKTLMDSFDQIIENTPYAFYVLENKIFYLAHTRRLKADQIPVAHIEAGYFRDLPKGTLVKSIRELTLPAEAEKDFQRLGLEYLYFFSGHSHIFSFLVVRPELHRILQHPSVLELFRRINNKSGLMLESSALHIDLEQKQHEIRKLLDVSQKILSELDIQKILDYILEALSELIEYDAAAIFLLREETQELLSTCSKGYASHSLLSLKVGQGSCGHVARSRTIEVIPNVDEAEHYYKARAETKSQISLPLLFENKVQGVICVESDEKDFFQEPDVELLKVFANQAALAIHNAHQVEIRLQKQALENELFHAGTVQRGLLIKRIPQIKGMHFIAENIPSQNVSGDLYDFIKFNDHTMGCIIGDVSGKGAPAALMMSLILASFRTQSKTGDTTCDVVNRLNELLTETTIEGKFTTLFYGIFNVEQNKLVYTNAGHNPPYLIRQNGEVITLSGGGLLLGFLKNQEYIQNELPLQNGDLFVAFTDGLSEAMNAEEEEFGEERILQIIRSNQDKDLFTIKSILLDAIRRFTGTDIHMDDITLMLARMEEKED